MMAFPELRLLVVLSPRISAPGYTRKLSLLWKIQSSNYIISEGELYTVDVALRQEISTL